MQERPKDTNLNSDTQTLDYKAENQHLKQALEYLEDGFVIYDNNDRLVHCNQAFKNLHGPIAEAIKPGISFEGIVRLGVEHNIWDLEGRNPDVFVAETMQRRRDTPESLSLVQFSDGTWMRRLDRKMESNFTVGLRVDFTETKAREEDLKNAITKAETAERAKSEFLANMSHEIRTPMNGVMGMAELLSKTELDAKQSMFTDVIVKSGASLLTIINDILDFSKLDAGQMELDPAPFVLAETIEDVATLVSSRVAEKDLELIVRVDPIIPQMMVGDAGRIRQIITNMMGNAVKFTEKGHIYVNVTPVGGSTGPDTNGKMRLRFDIEDTGIGIPQEDLDKIFKKFSQVDTSASRKHEGTGLGLSIATSLINLMGGEFGVESKVGHGSTFWFEVELPTHGERKAKRIPVDVTGSRILIVDDNVVNRSILSEQMASWNFDSAAAQSGEEALKVMSAVLNQNMTIDCLVLDYHMPDMDGGEVVRAMRQNPKFKDIPIIMLTSVDETKEGRTFSSLGVQGHLIKPARSSHLLETIINVLQDDKADMGPTQAAIAAARQLSAARASSEASANTHTKPEIAEKHDNHVVHKEQTPSLDVLVCEDNEVNQIVFSQILEGLRLNYRIANNGKAGLELYRQETPTVILMDVSMPMMNGLEVTAAIRNEENGSNIHTPIIGVTAHAIKGDMEKCLNAGMDDYLSKPISPDALATKIEKWMRDASSRKTA